MSNPQHHRPSEDFLRILRSVGAEGEIFTRQQILFYLREYILVRRLFDAADPRLINVADDPLGGVLSVQSFTIDEIEKLIDEQTSKSSADSKKYDDDEARPMARPSPFGTEEDVIHRLTTPEASPSRPSIIASTDPGVIVTPPDLSPRSRAKRVSSSAETATASSVSLSASPLSLSSLSFFPLLPWFFSQQRLSSASVASDEKSEILSLQGYETAPVEDSSDDLWFLESSSTVGVGGVERRIEAEGEGFQVEFEVESESEGDAEEDDDDEEEEDDEELLGQENHDYAFLSAACARADSDVEFWADHSSDEDDDEEEEEEEGVEFEFEEESRQQRRLIEGEEATSSESEADSDPVRQDKWRCGECGARNKPYVRYCERCWKLRPGWLHRMRRSRGRSNPDDKLDSDDEDAVEATQKNDAAKVEAPSGLLDFDWTGGESVLDGGGERNDDDRLTLKMRPLSTAEENQNVGRWSGAAAPSLNALPEESEKELRCWSRASTLSSNPLTEEADKEPPRCWSRSSTLSQISTTVSSHGEWRTVDSMGDARVGERPDAIGEELRSGAQSSMSTIGSQDSGFGGSQDLLSPVETRSTDSMAESFAFRAPMPSRGRGRFGTRRRAEEGAVRSAMSSDTNPFTIREPRDKSKAATLPARLFGLGSASTNYSTSRMAIEDAGEVAPDEEAALAAARIRRREAEMDIGDVHESGISSLESNASLEGLLAQGRSTENEPPSSGLDSGSSLFSAFSDISVPILDAGGDAVVDDAPTPGQAFLGFSRREPLRRAKRFDSSRQGRRGMESVESAVQTNAVDSLMDALPQIDRRRNISGSSATGSSTEELSAASGDDVPLFKRPVDGPAFCRKRKDRQSSSSSNASAFRTANHPSKRDRISAAGDYRLQSSGERKAKTPPSPRTSTVIFSIRGSSPNPSSKSPAISTISSTSASTVRTVAALSNVDNKGSNILNIAANRGTTVTFGHGTVTSLTVKRRKSRSPSSSSRKLTKEISTQCHPDDVETPEEKAGEASVEPSANADPLSDKCIICLTRPKSASIIHGYLGHQVCCCKCARKLRRLGKPCPICRRPIQHIVKNVIV